MPSGFYTHTATVLFDRAPTLDDVARVVPDATRRTIRDEVKSPWFGGADLLTTIDTERNGKLAIDVVARPWPDAMGDPKTDAPLFGAWTFGAFGAHTFPGALARACEQAWTAREVAARVPDHAAFVRLRTTYVIGGGDEAPLVPEGHSDWVDLEAITSRAIAILGLDGAIGYFDPEGEVLLSAAALANARDSDPIEAYAHVRLYVVDADRSLIDTVGMERFGLPDLEIAFAAAIDPNEIVRFARDTLHAHLREPIASETHESWVAPPRRVIRITR